LVTVDVEADGEVALDVDVFAVVFVVGVVVVVVVVGVVLVLVVPVVVPVDGAAWALAAPVAISSMLAAHRTDRSDRDMHR
jgi:hypothetical protein